MSSHIPLRRIVVGIEERQLNTFWQGNRATHAVMCSWGLSPQLHSVVFTVFWCEERLLESQNDDEEMLPDLPHEIWIEILKMLKCSDFGQQQALLAP